MNIEISLEDTIETREVIELYKANGWSSAMEKLNKKYKSFHQQMLTADADAFGFYKTLGFERAGKTEPMWIYSGNEH